MAHENINNSAFESDDESDDDSESSKKKKKAEDLAKFLAKKDKDKEAKPKVADEPTLWEKLTGEAKDKRAEDKEAPADNEVENETEEAASEVAAEDVETDDNLPLEEMDEAERADSVEAYITGRMTELSEVPEDETPEAAVARRADLALLVALNERMKQDHSMKRPLIDKIAEAYDDTSSDFAPKPVGGEFVPKDGGELPLEMDSDEPITLAAMERDEPLPARGSSGEYRLRPPSAATALTAETAALAGVTAANMIPRSEAMYYEQKAQARGLLVGAVVGYLIGRRRGRIKTEKRLKTVERKLKKQVTETQALVADKEREIQQLAVARYHQTGELPPVVPLVIPESKIIPPASTKPEAPPRKVEAKSEAKEPPTPSATQESRPAGRAERLTAEAVREPEVFAAPVPIAMEATTRSNQTVELRRHRVEAQPATPAKEAAQLTRTENPKAAIEKMNAQELLDYGARIPMGESNLRRVYDARLVNEEGLRRLIIAHETGQDMRRALAREFLARELKFEHDPRLHGVPLDDQQRQTGGGRAASDDYQADPVLAAAQAQSASASSATRRNRQASGYRRQQGVSPLLLIGLTIITIILAVYAIWLTVTR